MIGNKVEQAGGDYADECCNVFRRFKQSSANWRPWSASNSTRGKEGLRTIMRRNQRKDVGRRIKKHNVLKSIHYKAKVAAAIAQTHLIPVALGLRYILCPSKQSGLMISKEPNYDTHPYCGQFGYTRWLTTECKLCFIAENTKRRGEFLWYVGDREHAKERLIGWSCYRVTRCRKILPDEY